MFSPQDHALMAHALRLAEQGLHTTTPNPRVGCVILKDDKIVGEGAHLKAGEAHAEIHALIQAGEQAKGATVYVTLEPCNHHGRTPPCTDALIKAGVARVIVATQDPNPLVAGQGLIHLAAQGIKTQVGLMQAQADALNHGFNTRMTREMPFVVSKIAASLDGKTALHNGQSQWISSEAARADAQRLRARSCAILTGAGTVRHDNPRLTVRDFDIGRQPLRVVADSTLQTPMDALVLQGGNTVIAYARDSQSRAQALLDAGIGLICLPNNAGKVCLSSLLQHLAKLEINELLVEGGAGLNGALLQQKLIDELIIYQAPIVLGHHAQGMFDFATLTDMQQKISLQILETRQIGMDTRIRAVPKYVD